MIPPLAQQHFVVEPREGGGAFRLVEKPLLGRERIIPPDRWSATAAGHLLAGAGRLLAWLAEGQAKRDGDALIVGHATIASLDERSARSIGLPPAAPLVLDLRHEGTIDRPEFRFRAAWTNANGRPEPGVRRTGAFLSSGSRLFRLTQPHFDLAEAVDAFNAAPPDDMDERFRIWGRIYPELPEETYRSITLDGYLRSTRIAHATRFSLDISSSADGFRFDPVLFGSKLPVSEDDPEALPSQEHALLPRERRDTFSERFRRAPECRARYALDGGWYAVVDEPVRQALTVVRRAQGADRETRRQFARNPRAFIREALGESFDESLIDALFIETAEFSDRVRDVTLWTPIVVPWVQRTGEAWLPERFGVRIGDTSLTVEAERLPEVEAQLRQAIAEGRPSIRIAGMDVPANEEALAAVHELVVASQPAAKEAPSGEEARDQPEDQEEPPLGGRLVLEIIDNLVEASYRATLRPKSLDLPDGPLALLETAPKPHQQDGIRWLQSRWREGSPGVLLADDMGLGKTLQALAFLAWLKAGMDAGRLSRKPFLIVAPTGLLKNWQAEHDRHLHAPGLGEVVQAWGGELKRLRRRAGTDIKAGEPLLDEDQLKNAAWILTTYETMRDYQLSFAAVHFAAIVFDEAQRIKTPGVLVTHAAKALNSDFYVAMTGTPIENRLADLWCIVDTAYPGRLRDLKSFSQTYEAEAEPARLHQLKATLTDGDEKTPALMLRRMKADHLPGLPEKHEHVVAERMPPEQAQAYDRAVAAARIGTGKGSMLEALHQLRGISLHPVSPDEATDDRYVEQSARLRAAFQILNSLRDRREKALIFLESLDMQGYLAALLQRRYRLAGLPMIINGAVAGPDRQKRVDLFQTGGTSFDVMILSPRAGGVGLTLTAANHVIHLSRWWNPAVEDQCTDRVYRIGQERDVHVYYLQAIHPEFGEQSFDERLHDLLERKRALSREMLMPPLDPENDARKLYEDTVGATVA
jgi:superfamily II DNA or RNA helicase